MKAIIIGSGTAGVTLAERLLNSRSDIAIEMIEAGSEISKMDRRVWLDYVANEKRNDPFRDYQELPTDQVVESGDGSLQVAGSRYFGTGGSASAWGGWCLEYQQEDFFLKSNTGHGIDWPYSKSTLEPFYSKAAETLWVAGQGKPNAPIPFILKDGVIIEALERLGFSYEHLGLARKESCVTIGTCKYCPVGARYAPNYSLGRLIAQFPERFTLRTASFVTRLLMRSKRICKGVEVLRKSDGYIETIDADLVVVAGGALETPKLLLASKNEFWSRGIGNDSGHVGRHLTIHPLIRVVGLRAGNPDNFEQPVDFPTLACRQFDSIDYQSVGKLFFVHDGRLNATRIEDEWLSGHSSTSIRRSMRTWLPFELRGFIETFSADSNYIDLDPATSSFGGLKTKVSFSINEQIRSAIDFGEAELGKILKEAGCQQVKPATSRTIRADHATSTCRMSIREAEGVVDPNLKLHGTENIFLCSNACLPNGAAVNPTLTLIAVTEKLADHLQKQ